MKFCRKLSKFFLLVKLRNKFKFALRKKNQRKLREKNNQLSLKIKLNLQRLENLLDDKLVCWEILLQAFQDSD